MSIFLLYVCIMEQRIQKYPLSVHEGTLFLGDSTSKYLYRRKAEETAVSITSGRPTTSVTP